VRRANAKLTQAVVAARVAKNHEPTVGQRVDSDGSTSSAPATAAAGSKTRAAKSVARR
jgi:hypothetical protein